MDELIATIKEAEQKIRKVMEKHADEFPKEFWASLTVYSYYASYYDVVDKNGPEENEPITLMRGWTNEQSDEKTA